MLLLKGGWVLVGKGDVERSAFSLSRGVEPEFTSAGYYREAGENYYGPYKYQDYQEDLLMREIPAKD